jgi:hypothetical protein
MAEIGKGFHAKKQHSRLEMRKMADEVLPQRGVSNRLHARVYH